jgi:hypothetical protein
VVGSLGPLETVLGWSPTNLSIKCDRPGASEDICLSLSVTSLCQLDKKAVSRVDSGQFSGSFITWKLLSSRSSLSSRATIAFLHQIDCRKSFNKPLNSEH